MKRKHTGILLVLVVIVGGAGLILQKRNQSQWSESAAPESGKVLDFPVNDVAHVEIRSPKGEVHLAKKNGVWVVAEKADYPADFQRVSGLIRQLWELRPVQQIKVGPSQSGRLELTEPDHDANAQPAATSRSDAGAAGTVVELKNENDKTLAKIILGKRVMAKENGQETLGRFPSMPMGRYVLAPGNGGNVSLVNQRLEFDALPQSWLKHDFVKIENPESISLTGQTGPKHWTLTRSDAKADLSRSQILSRSFLKGPRRPDREAKRFAHAISNAAKEPVTEGSQPCLSRYAGCQPAPEETLAACRPRKRGRLSSVSNSKLAIRPA